MENWMQVGAAGTIESGERIWGRTHASPDTAGWPHHELIGLELHFGYQIIRFLEDNNATIATVEDVPDAAMDGPLAFLRGGEADMVGDVIHWIHKHRERITYSLGNAIHAWVAEQC